MKYADINIFCCPECRGNLRFLEVSKFDRETQEVSEGLIICADCQCKYSVIESIPRFTKPNTYAASFGYQWNKFIRTQHGAQQKEISRIRFYATTKWPEHLRGQLVLEAGCGAGRFTEIALDTGAEVYSFDLIDAAKASMADIKSSDSRRRHYFFQADIYNIPLPYGMFDKIFCFGVLQHCPDVRRAYLSLVPFLKPGGELAVDCYLKQPLKDIFNPKYLFRPFLKWWRPSWLYIFCSITISLSYAMKKILAGIPLAGAFLYGIIPIGRLDYEPRYHFSAAEIKEIKTLSMFDMFSPKYDQPQKISSFRLWMQDAGLEILELAIGYNGINARARRPIH